MNAYIVLAFSLCYEYVLLFENDDYLMYGKSNYLSVLLVC